MSRTGNKTIEIPQKVKVQVNNGLFLVEGPLGKEQVAINPKTEVKVEGSTIRVLRSSEDRTARSVHGMMRALLANAVNGVSTGFTKKLEINGVGYRAEVKGKTLVLSLGYSHPVNFDIPEKVKIKVDGQTKLEITSSDKQLLGQICADIRKKRPPEPYKGKGVKYSDETIIRKVGKAAGGK